MSDFSPEFAVDVDSVGFADKGFRVFYRSLGHTPVRSALYDYHARQKAGLNKNKDRIRQWTIGEVASFFKDKTKCLRILTLPGPLLTFEKNMRRTFSRSRFPGLLLTGVEKDWTTFGCASLELARWLSNEGRLNDKHPLRHSISPTMNCQVVSGSNVVLIHDDIFNFATHGKNRHDCIWLDIQSPISYLREKIPFLIERAIVGGNTPAMFILTVLARREHEPLEMSRVEFAKTLLPGFDLRKEWSYHDADARSEMLHLIFTRNAIEATPEKIDKPYVYCQNKRAAERTFVDRGIYDLNAGRQLVFSTEKDVPIRFTLKLKDQPI